MKAELAGFETAKGTVRFTPDKPIPDASSSRSSGAASRKTQPRSRCARRRGAPDGLMKD